MTKNELLEIINNGETISVEFNLEDVKNKALAKEICAICNHGKGLIFIGVDDLGAIIGCQRTDNEERIMNICNDLITPRICPDYMECFIENKRLVVVKINKTPDKPYAILKNNAYKYYTRLGTSCREADRNELLRLFQRSSLLHYEILERKNATIDNIDIYKFKEYLNRLFVSVDETDIHKVMINKKLLTKEKIPTLAGLVLFGKNIETICPMLKVEIVKFANNDSDYHIINQRSFYGALLNSYDDNGNISQLGLIDKCMDYIKINIKMSSHLNLASRETHFEYPIETIRELLVNCLAHRDYTIEGEGIRIFIYRNRIEFISPGGLPNSIDVQSLQNSLSYGVVPTYARNPIIVEILKRFAYIENIGMGIYKKVYVLMKKHNNTEPTLEDTGQLFRVIIWSKKAS